MVDDSQIVPNKTPKWSVGKLGIRNHSHEDLLAMAKSFLRTETFLDAVQEVLEKVDALFELRPLSNDRFLSFLDPPPQVDDVTRITTRLVVLHLAWKIANAENPTIASFNGDTLEHLREEIHSVSRDAIDAAQGGDQLQKWMAVYKSREGITGAFYRLNRIVPSSSEV